MLRLTELALFFSPFVLVAAWLLLGRRLAILAWPVLGVAIVLAVVLLGFSQRHSMPRNAAYVPAQLQDGAIVDGHSR